MIGRKTLSQVRAELEAALGQGPAGGGEVAESLRRFLAARPGGNEAPNHDGLESADPDLQSMFKKPGRDVAGR